MQLKKITKDIIEQAECNKIKEVDDGEESIKTGFKDFDHATGGLWRGETYILAGASGAGKSTLVYNLINNISIKQGFSTAYLSLDIDEYQFINRLMKVVSRDLLPTSLNGNSYPDDSITNCEMSWKLGIEKIDKANIYCDDCKFFNSDMLLKALKELDKSVDLVIIDSLSILDEKAVDRAEIIQSIKSVATKFNCTVIVVYQIKHVAKVSGIANSFELTQLSKIDIVDNILLLTSDIPKYFKADITMEKTSSSDTGVVSLAYNPFLQEFKSL